MHEVVVDPYNQAFEELIVFFDFKAPGDHMEPVNVAPLCKDDPVVQWCNSTCQGAYEIEIKLSEIHHLAPWQGCFDITARFQLASDAVLFKLTWV